MVLGFPKPVGIYPFTKKVQGKDIGPIKNPTGRLYGVRPDRGPNGRPGGSTRFPGRPGSKAILPNKGGLDPRDSITIIAWVKPSKPGSILEYIPRGVKLSMPTRRVLQVTFRRRNGKPTKPVISRQRLKPNRWNYVAATYDQRRNQATLWLDSRPITSRNIGWIRLKTNTRKIRIGGRNFRGSISCVQIYSQALDGEQIKAVKDICIEPGILTYIEKTLKK